MPRDARAYLFDMQSAATLAWQFTNGKSLDEYKSDILLRSATERQLAIVGEALNQLLKIDPQFGERFSERRRLIAFRNRVIHGYATVDDDIVWSIARTKLPVLLDEIAALVRELDGNPP